MNRQAGRPRVVFDCNTFVQAIALEKGPAAECLRLAETGRFELFISKPILAELRRVLTYPRVVAMAPSLTPERVAAFLKRLSFRATLVRRVRHVMDYPRDPKDEPYIDLAATAKADYLVTRDKDLLSLMTGHSPAAKEFRRKTRPLVVLNPVAFLSTVQQQVEDAT
jgi:putative PIN family toxin of toxin-antitoxin system